MRAMVRRSRGRLAFSVMTLGVLGGFGAAASYAISVFIAKELIESYAPSFVVAMYSVMYGIVYLTAVRYTALPRVEQVRSVGFRWAVLAGLGLAGGIGFFYLALSEIPLSIAAPMVGIRSLVTYTLVLLLLRGTERITRRVLVGASLVVAGVALIGTTNA